MFLNFSILKLKVEILSNQSSKAVKKVDFKSLCRPSGPDTVTDLKSWPDDRVKTILDRLVGYVVGQQ